MRSSQYLKTQCALIPSFLPPSSFVSVSLLLWFFSLSECLLLLFSFSFFFLFFPPFSSVVALLRFPGMNEIVGVLLLKVRSCNWNFGEEEEER